MSLLLTFGLLNLPDTLWVGDTLPGSPNTRWTPQSALIQNSDRTLSPALAHVTWLKISELEWTQIRPLCGVLERSIAEQKWNSGMGWEAQWPANAWTTSNSTPLCPDSSSLELFAPPGTQAWSLKADPKLKAPKWIPPETTWSELWYWDQKKWHIWNQSIDSLPPAWGIAWKAAGDPTTASVQTELSIEPRLFSPYQAGADRLKISWRSAGGTDKSLRIQIRDRRGALVREIWKGNAGDTVWRALEWDGFDDQNRPLRPGRYRVILQENTKNQLGKVLNQEVVVYP
jgi:hypothetical protein